jgi:hypothetical protein
MALHLQFASLSLSASVDQQTNHLSVFDIVDEVRVAQVPAQIQSLVISLALIREEPHQNGGRLFIDLVPPDGKVARVGQGELQIPGPQRRMKAVFRFSNFPVLQMGFYRFVVSWTDPKGEKEGEAVLDFEVVQSEERRPGPAAPQGTGNGGSGSSPMTH